MRIILSRTDNLGDVMLTLPTAGVIKIFLPESQVLFLGKPYTRPLIESCKHIDEFYDWEKIEAEGLRALRADAIVHVLPRKEIAVAAKKAGIKTRIGTSHRLFHLLTCNKLIKLGRKNSDLHEAQLNIKLLKPLGITTDVLLDEVHNYYGWKSAAIHDEVKPFISSEKFNLILHPKSKGSAIDWKLNNFYALAKQLDKEKFNIILTGTSSEGDQIKAECPEIFDLSHVKNASGKLDLHQLINLIQHGNGLVACSTGPLHIAAASGIHCLGLYSANRPMHARRWGPLGVKADYVEDDGDSVKHLNIPVEQVLARIRNWKR